MAGSKIEVIKYEPNDPRLGRHVEHDERSWQHTFMLKSRAPKQITTHWTCGTAPLDQGDLGSCTGNATAQWLNTDYAIGGLYAAGKVKRGQFFNEQSAVEIYSKASKLDAIPGGYQPDDTGSTGNAACKAARALGYVKGYRWLFSFTSVQAAIETQPLLTGTLWTDTMFTPNNGLVKIGALIDSNIAGGHEYLMTGIDWGENVFEFRNSWGEWPGAKPGGYFAISFADYRKLLEADGDVTVPQLL